MLTFIFQFVSFSPFYNILRLCLILAPKVFYWGYNIVKPLMSARTLSKIRIFETSNASWQTELRDLLPECAIPEIFGGSGKMTSFY